MKAANTTGNEGADRNAKCKVQSATRSVSGKYIILKIVKNPYNTSYGQESAEQVKFSK